MFQNYNPAPGGRHLSIYLYICVYISIYFFICVYLSMFHNYDPAPGERHLSILSIHLSIYIILFIYLSTSGALSIYQSLYLCLSIYLFICVYLSMFQNYDPASGGRHLSVLSIHLSIHIIYPSIYHPTLYLCYKSKPLFNT